MKSIRVFVLLAAAAAVVLFFVWSSRKTPRIPVDDLHRIITTNAACRVCHGPGKIHPLKAVHPLREECLFCHRKGL